MRRIKHFFTILTVMSVAFLTSLSAHAHKHSGHDMHMKDKIYVINHYADWCGTCKVLDPKVEKARASLPAETLEKLNFVTFDLTDSSTKSKSKMMADEKGLSKHFENARKTGYFLIVNAKGDVIGRIGKDMSHNDIVETLTSSILRS